MRHCLRRDLGWRALIDLNYLAGNPFLPLVGGIVVREFEQQLAVTLETFLLEVVVVPFSCSVTNFLCMQNMVCKLTQILTADSSIKPCSHNACEPCTKIAPLVAIPCEQPAGEDALGGESNRGVERAHVNCFWAVAA